MSVALTEFLCKYAVHVKAKFHYAIWLQTGSKLVRDQLRTSFEPDSVMEFGLYQTKGGDAVRLGR